MRAALILGAYVAGVAGYFAGLWAIWPWLLVACACAAPWAWRAALPLFCGILVAQYIKAEYEVAQIWVYYAAAYATLGFISTLLWDRIGGVTCGLIALIFLASYFGASRFAVGALTESALIAGLVGAAYRGPMGGLFRGLRPIARPAPTSGRLSVRR